MTESNTRSLQHTKEKSKPVVFELMLPYARSKNFSVSDPSDPEWRAVGSMHALESCARGLSRPTDMSSSILFPALLAQSPFGERNHSPQQNTLRNGSIGQWREGTEPSFFCLESTELAAVLLPDVWDRHVHSIQMV